MAVVGYGEVILRERLVPSPFVVRPACIELVAQSAACHIVAVGADGIGGNLGIPTVRIVVGILDDGTVVVAADDIAARRTDVHLADHEAVRE